MSEKIVSLADVRAHRQGWTKHELAHFRRAASLFWESGLSIETASGLTDEGDAWFVFCDANSGDVLAHFAKVGGKNVVCAPSLDDVLLNRILPDLLERIVDAGHAAASRQPGGRSPPAA